MISFRVLKNVRLLRPGRALLHQNSDVVRVDQVGRGPSVKVIFRHALFREALILFALPRRVGHHQRLESDALVIAEVVPLVQFVAAAELGDRKSTRLNSSHSGESRMPSSA